MMDTEKKTKSEKAKKKPNDIGILLKVKGWTQSQLAKELGVSQVYVSQLESGVRWHGSSSRGEQTRRRLNEILSSVTNEEWYRLAQGYMEQATKALSFLGKEK